MNKKIDHQSPLNDTCYIHIILELDSTVSFHRKIASAIFVYKNKYGFYFYSSFLCFFLSNRIKFVDFFVLEMTMHKCKYHAESIMYIHVKDAND